MYTLEGLIASAKETEAHINGKWVAARPVRLFSFYHDIKDAWAVLTRKADAFTWPEGQ